MIFDFRFEWKPYRSRTNLRIALPVPFGSFSKKGLTANPSVLPLGATDDRYNCDNETSGCYHFQVERAGQLWPKKLDSHSLTKPLLH
jgi:hypothetical protein